MKKSNQNLQNPSQFFAQLKQYLKAKGTHRLRFQKLKQFWHTNNQQQTALSKIMQYIHNKTRFDKQKSNQQCAIQLNKILMQDRFASQRFKIDVQGIVYVAKYSKITDQKVLLQQIENTPQGILVDDQLLKFKQVDDIDIRDSIQSLIYKRLILPVKSKGIEKAKIKQNNYEGYLLFPYPPQIKAISESVFKPLPAKITLQRQGQKDRQQRQAKIAKIYNSKISNYRKQFIAVCSANISKGQDKSGLNQNNQSYQKIFQSWDQKNKRSIPNFQREAEEWFKSRK